MLPVSELPLEIARAVRVLFTDIDDTLTDGGRLGSEAYRALWQLHDAGIAVVPVTGRPAGWCDLIARQWPVAGVVGENGALAFAMDGSRLRRLWHPDARRDQAAERLAVVRDSVMREVPGARVAADQAFRMFDLAIDFREDPPDLGFEAAERIRAVFERHGARAKVSSIHVNGWFGAYDKLAMVRIFAAEVLGFDVDGDRARAVFVGDSPNDEPMFAHFPHACGVANVRDFVATLQSRPRYVTAARGGAGFAEIAERLVASRAPTSAP